jgi:hypothetical protein
MKNIYKKFAKEFLPEKIEYLLIGESPPKSPPDAEELRYLYNYKDYRGNQSLLSNISYAFFKEKFYVRRDSKREYLEKISQEQIFLIDAVYEPINHINNTIERKSIISEGYPDLKKNIKKLPLNQDAKIFLIHNNVVDAIGDKIRNDFKIYRVHNIGFPHCFHDPEFRRKIQEVINLRRNISIIPEEGKSKSNPRNSFVALCELASRENWCWNIYCTTCGCMYFRYAFVELVEGKHPDEKTWLTCKKNHNKLDRFTEPVSFKNKWPIDAQRELLKTAAQADITQLSKVATFPDWLGHIGLVLLFCSDAEHKTRLLTESLIPQFQQILGPSSFEISCLNEIYSDKRRFLDWRDLELVENGLQRNR